MRRVTCLSITPIHPAVVLSLLLLLLTGIATVHGAEPTLEPVAQTMATPGAVAQAGNPPPFVATPSQTTPQPAAGSARKVPEKPDYQAARWHPLHFKPAIDQASNADCLACHEDILKQAPLPTTPAGVRANQVLAWYQTIGGYAGAQDTFHRRHLTTPLANQVMDLKCSFCHRGHDPREQHPELETPQGAPRFTLRKTVNVADTCLRCHGRFPFESMELPGPWQEVGESVQNNCLACHATIRTNRHQVNYLKAEAIEALGEKDADTCFGCHGGRPWYRIAFTYPRHAWPDMPNTTPEWAAGRAKESEERFRLSGKKP